MSDDSFLVGIDEVGRGCLAGPVVAAAVILNKEIIGLKDSKKMTKIKREQVDKLIRKDAISFSIGISDVEMINAHGLTFAVSNAMRLALDGIRTSYKRVIIDGNYNFLKDIKNVELVIRADDTIPAVSAASIIAKVYRDNLMTELSKKYPLYNFEKNVGYGTKHHLDMLKLHGPTNIHRMFYKPVVKYS